VFVSGQCILVRLHLRGKTPWKKAYSLAWRSFTTPVALGRLRENPRESVKKTLTHASGITRWRSYFCAPNLHLIAYFNAP
jgi:hypothetical protein